MPNKFVNSYEIGSLSIDNKIGLFAGDGLPDVEVLGAPVGSVYFRSDGSRYNKTGTGDALVDWTLDSSSSSTTGIEFSIIGW